jgi:hypothetical protein
MSSVSVQVDSVTLTGVKSTIHDVEINQYRGIKYGIIPGRFQRARLNKLGGEGMGKEVDCSAFG